jgi:hypothetical protein
MHNYHYKCNNTRTLLYFHEHLRGNESIDLYYIDEITINTLLLINV